MGGKSRGSANRIFTLTNNIFRLRNGLLCVEWDVKPYTLTHSLMYAFDGVSPRHLEI